MGYLAFLVGEREVVVFVLVAVVFVVVRFVIVGRLETFLAAVADDLGVVLCVGEIDRLGMLTFAAAVVVLQNGFDPQGVHRRRGCLCGGGCSSVRRSAVIEDRLVT